MPKAAACTLVWLSEQEIYALRVPGEEGQCEVEGEGWFERLAGRVSFAFHGQAGHLTLRREARQRGSEGYWYAYRNDGARTLKRYAGRTADLSIERLEALAAELTGMLEREGPRVPQTVPVQQPLADQGNSQKISLLPVGKRASTNGRANESGRMPEALAGSRRKQTLPLLAPKLSMPRLPAGLIAREALLARLDTGLERKLTLLCAPAGFGKTTLASQWLAHLSTQAQHAPAVAWLALDGGDNDPVRFWTYVITACQALNDGIGQAALAHLRPQEATSFEQNWLEIPLTLLLNEVSQAPARGVLVLEDYHVINEPQIHTSLAFLLDHLPASLHLVLVTRGEPPLPLTRLRARGELNELGTAELRLSTTETHAFLAQTLALEPARETVSRVESLLEGWVTGLRLLTLALQGTVSEQELEQRLASFSGDQRHLLAYFNDEVLATQTADVQHFLLQTCLFNALNAAFCDAVTGREDSEQILSTLEWANLFLLPLAGQERWYRYHPLFAEALRYEARQRLSEADRRACFLRASQWYEHSAQLAEAIEAALQARSFARAAGLIEQMTGPQRLHEMREHHTLQRWLLALPAETLERHPILNLLLAMVYLFAANCQGTVPADVLARAEQPLRAAERAWQAAENRAGLGEALAFRVVLARFQRDVPRAVRLARQALTWLAEDARQWRATCLSTLGDDELHAGRLDEAHRTFQEAHACFTVAGNHYGQRVALLALAEICLQRGRLREGATLYQEVLASAGDDLTDQGLALLGLAGLAYEWNELDLAESQTRAAQEIGTRVGAEELQLLALLLLARVESARGQTANARQHLSALLARAQTQPSPLLYRQVYAHEVQLHLVNGDPAAGQRWLTMQAAHAEALPIVQQEREKLLEARLLTAQGQSKESHALLTGVLQTARQQGRVHDEIEALLLSALTFHKQQREEQARAFLYEALARAHGEGYVRLFLDEGEPVAELLRALPPVSETKALAAYAHVLLLAYSGTRTEPGSPGGLDTALALPSIEPLSPQEQRVLQLLANGYANQEIARELVVSTNTVKTQVQSIYRKLNVHSRQEARRALREQHHLLPFIRSQE